MDARLKNYFDKNRNLVERALRQGIQTLEASADAEAEWVEAVLELAGGTADFSEGCTPGYYNNEGQPSRASQQNGFYFGGPTGFVDILEKWRADGEMQGLELG